MSRQDLMREVGRMWNEKKGDEEVEKEEVKEEVNKGKKGKNVIQEKKIKRNKRNSK